LETEKQERKKRKKKEKWGLVRHTTFIVWEREISMFLTAPSQHPFFLLVQTEIRETKNKNVWKVAYF
jgi:hypothetical protein